MMFFASCRGLRAAKMARLEVDMIFSRAAFSVSPCALDRTHGGKLTLAGAAHGPGRVFFLQFRPGPFSTLGRIGRRVV
jgi:hypothetical protein